MSETTYASSLQCLAQTGEITDTGVENGNAGVKQRNAGLQRTHTARQRTSHGD